MPKYRWTTQDVDLFRVAVAGPLIGEPPQVGIQRVEYLAGYRCPVIGGPAPDDGVEPLLITAVALVPRRDRISVLNRSRIRLRAALLGLISSFAAVSADVEPQEVKTIVEADDPRLVLVEGQTPGRKPPGKPRLDLKRLGLCVAQGDEIVGVPDKNRGAFRRAGRPAAVGSGLRRPSPSRAARRSTALG